MNEDKNGDFSEVTVNETDSNLKEISSINEADKNAVVVSSPVSKDISEKIIVEETNENSFVQAKLTLVEDDEPTESLNETKEDDGAISQRSFLESLNLDVPSSYEVEPVDFPKSPWFSIKKESQLKFISDEDKDKSTFQAQLLLNGHDVHLSKDDLANGDNKKRIIPVGNDIFADTYCEESSFDGSHTSLDEADFDAYLDSPDELDDSIMERLGEEKAEPIPELSAAEERSESLCWKSCIIGGIERRIDLKVLEPYKRVVSHGGYLSRDPCNAIIIFSACYLPDRSRADYDYVMNNLFMYVVTTLDHLVTDDYVLIYLHGATPRSCMPKFKWLKLCYQMIDRKLKKNLKSLYLVHPTFWLKTLVLMTKPFISSKFSRKLFFINSLKELFKVVPLEENYIPERVKKYDELKEFLEKD